MTRISSDPKGIDEHLLQLLIPQEILQCFILNQIIESRVTQGSFTPAFPRNRT